MTEDMEEAARWSGRELLDAGGKVIGTVEGLAFSRKRFGTPWLVVRTPTGARLAVPAAPIRSSAGRLVLPYPKTYVESTQALPDDRPLTRDEEHRLCLHYGLDSQVPGSECRTGCGLCWIGIRTDKAKRRSDT